MATSVWVSQQANSWIHAQTRAQPWDEGQVDGQTGGWMDKGWLDRWTYRRMEGQVDGCTDGWMDKGWLDRWTDRWTSGWTDRGRE